MRHVLASYLGRAMKSRHSLRLTWRALMPSIRSFAVEGKTWNIVWVNLNDINISKVSIVSSQACYASSPREAITLAMVFSFSVKNMEVDLILDAVEVCRRKNEAKRITKTPSTVGIRIKT